MNYIFIPIFKMPGPGFYGIIILMTISFQICAQTIIPGGYVSGTWSSAGSPFIIEDDILIHPDSTLVVEAGTEVLFSGAFSLEVQGQLVVTGTEAAYVTFDRENDTVSWRGIFLNTTDTSITDSSVLEYASIRHCFGGSCLIVHHSSRVRVSNCTISNGESFRGGGINCRFSNPRFENLLVRNNHALDGAGIALEGSNAVLYKCDVQMNTADGAGGGMVIFSTSSPLIDSCTIAINSSNGSGGGVYINDSSPVFLNSTISYNTAAQDGGDIYSGAGISVKLDSEPLFKSCRIYDNTCWSNGAGIASFSPVYMINCMFLSNFSYGEGGAIFLSSGNPITSHLSNCTFDHNSANHGSIIACNNHIAVTRNCILWDKWNSNPNSMIFLNSIMALDMADIDFCDLIHGQSSIELAGNATYIWGINNIDKSPQWESMGWALSWDSPCIEAGTPDTTGLGLPEFDLDGNPRIVNMRVDMGAWEYQLPVGIRDSTFQIPGDFILYPNPADDQVYLDFGETSQDGRVNIISTSGSLIYDIEMTSQRIMLNCADFAPGIYMVQYIANDRLSVKKLMIY